MEQEIMILEYNEHDGMFHYNLLEYVSGTRGYKAISLCNYFLASEFANKYAYKGLSYYEICKKWEEYFNDNRNEFLKIGLK